VQIYYKKRILQQKMVGKFKENGRKVSSLAKNALSLPQFN
jgi:hypothetical protein